MSELLYALNTKQGGGKGGSEGGRGEGDLAGRGEGDLAGRGEGDLAGRGEGVQSFLHGNFIPEPEKALGKGRHA